MVKRSQTAAQTPQSTPQYLQPEFAAINCAHRTDGQKGKIVKTRNATEVPRFRVGASSDVTARAVSSLIPAPAPAMVMPAVHLMSPSFSALVVITVLTNEDVHTVRSRGHNHPKDDQGRAHYSYISAAHEIGK